MLTVIKNKTEFGDSFQVFTNDGIFEIFFGGNLDLYWRYNDRNSSEKSMEKKVLSITKENYFLFQLFDTLYYDIRDYHIFIEDEFRTLEMVNQLNDSFKEYHCYEHNLLFVDNKIIWYSDDYDMDEASFFEIEPSNDSYILTFNKSKNDFFQTYAVRIRNSGSRYDPFNVPFMRMYYKICEYDSNYHQIHMEEYLFHMNKVRKKETI